MQICIVVCREFVSNVCLRSLCLKERFVGVAYRPPSLEIEKPGPSLSEKHRKQILVENKL